MSALGEALTKYLLALGNTMEDDSHVMTIVTGEVIPFAIWEKRFDLIHEVCTASKKISHDHGMFIVEKVDEKVHLSVDVPAM